MKTQERYKNGAFIAFHGSTNRMPYPHGNLDSKTSYSIMDLFTELHDRGNTIIMVTHEEDIAAYSKRIVRLKDGLISSDKKN